MKEYKIEGGDGTKIHVEETGNPQGKPILFIHGISQCRLCWNKQVNSDLAEDFRLVTMDLRGHGLSEKPEGKYAETQLWADDVKAVIDGLEVEKPVLTGWSYGGIVICDYLKHYGDAEIGGVHFVAAASKSGSELLPFTSPELLAITTQFISNVTEESVAGLQKFVQNLFYEEATPEELYFFLGFNVIVPPHVRISLSSRSLTNDDILAKITKPVLISHGENDKVVLLDMSKHNTKQINHAQTSYYSNTGHAPFWENPERFNAELRSFMTSL